MKKYCLTLKSLTPYMQHRMDDISLAEWEKCRKQIIAGLDSIWPLSVEKLPQNPENFG